MAPFEIHVTIGLQESTIDRLGRVFTACIGGARTPAPQVPEPAKAPVVKPAEPKPAKAPEAPAPEAEKADLMTINAAVVRALGKGTPEQEIRDLVASYGVKKVSELPEAKRAEFLKKVKDLPLPF